MDVQTYQWNAVDYAKSSGVQQQWARELINKLNLKGGEKLLDIGSGDGKITGIDLIKVRQIFHEYYTVPEKILMIRRIIL